MEPHDFFARLDGASEQEVRTRLAAGNYNSQHASLAHEWLRRKEESRAADSAAKRDAREEATLAIATEANDIAKRALSTSEAQASATARASRYAMYAAIVATIALATSIREEIFALVTSWLR